MRNAVLIVAAHPDDEALGAGGVIAFHAAKGDVIHIAFMADGEGARGDNKGIDGRRESASTAAKALGVPAENLVFFDFPDNRMDSVPMLDITKALESLIKKIGSNIVYTHHEGDLNIDHRLTHQAVLTACRPLPGSSVSAIYGFEVLSSTEWASPETKNAFIPRHYVDIAAHWKKKLAALKAYDKEMRPFPHPRSYQAAQALAELRGSQVGLLKAEAFTIIRQIAT